MGRWLAGIAAVFLFIAGGVLALRSEAEEPPLPAAPQPGRITLAELVEPRRKSYARLDVNSDGRLSFEEWAVTTIDKFEGADADRNKSLTAAEYATTAPKPRKKPACSCG